jgi:class 3 adenylate cyclase
MDVAAWLHGLGLEQYAQLFRDNDIDGEILRGMTSEDLKELGISSFGHRRKLFNAITTLGSEPLTRAVAQSAVSATSAPGDAERRQLTVMFCDLVGSTALSTRFDPEDLRELIGDYHRAVADTVGRFDGFVAKYMGDGVLIYFGYPLAHEDDAERAVRTGLAVIEAVDGLPARQDLRVRLGIATGLAVVGDLIGEGAAQERGVVGETPNLAARLQALAEPNTIIIGEATRRQVGGLFELTDLGPQALAGFAELQSAWRVVGESGMQSRFEALRSGETQLVGREEEVELLLRRWQRAKSGEGRVVLLSGEPGIGKSRLTAALSEHIGSEPHTRLRFFCSPHHQNSALYPFIAQLERAAGFAREDTVEARLGKLRVSLARGTRDNDDIALLSELLSLPSSAPEFNLSPQRKRERLFEALLNLLEAEAQHRPVLMVFEDAQWGDPTSRELLDLTVDRVRRLSVLVVITFRPEFQPPWGGRAQVTSLSLNRLSEGDGEVLVRKLAGSAALATDIIAEIAERADGVPLFVEELTKAVLESATQGDRVAAVLESAALTAQSVPANLHASLMARLDRLGPAAKEIAQIGAVLGREFAYELMEPVAQRPEKELRATLDQLSDAGLLFCRGTAPHASYLFKHALVQDAAYSTLLRGRLRGLHARVAAALEEHFADLVERRPELLAHHLTAAGDTERAVNQWANAGQHAAKRSAHREAIGHFDRGLASLGSLPETAERDRQEVELRLANGASLIMANGFASPDAAEAYTRAQDLSEKQGDTYHLLVALFGLWNFARTSDFDAARTLSNRMLVLTRDNNDIGLRLQAQHAAWTTSFFRGEPLPGRSQCEEGRRLYDFERHRSHTMLYGGHDPGVCARSIGGFTNWLIGYPHQSLASGTDAVALAERLGHPFTLGITLLQATVLHHMRREPGMVLQRVHAAEIVAAEQRLSLHIDPRVLRGGALAAQGGLAEAVAVIREGLSERNRAAAKLYRPFCLHSMRRRSKVRASMTTPSRCCRRRGRLSRRPASGGGKRRSSD